MYLLNLATLLLVAIFDARARPLGHTSHGGSRDPRKDAPTKRSMTGPGPVSNLMVVPSTNATGTNSNPKLHAFNKRAFDGKATFYAVSIVWPRRRVIRSESLTRLVRRSVRGPAVDRSTTNRVTWWRSIKRNTELGTRARIAVVQSLFKAGP